MRLERWGWGRGLSAGGRLTGRCSQEAAFVAGDPQSLGVLVGSLAFFSVTRDKSFYIQHSGDTPAVRSRKEDEPGGSRGGGPRFSTVTPLFSVWSLHPPGVLES